MDNLSNKVERATTADPVNERIAANVRALRAERGLSLDAVSRACGVSRSALSLIERAESSPTAAVLDRIAVGLGVPLASLFGDTAGRNDPPRVVARHDEQPVWRDPSSGYLRRSVSPDGHASPIRIVEVTFPPRARVAFETSERDRVTHQQIWVLEGAIEFTIGTDTHRLDAGDCLATRLDRPTMFHNPTSRAARYAVVVATEPVARR